MDPHPAVPAREEPPAPVHPAVVAVLAASEPPEPKEATEVESTGVMDCEAPPRRVLDERSTFSEGFELGVPRLLEEAVDPSCLWSSNGVTMA